MAENTARKVKTSIAAIPRVRRLAGTFVSTDGIRGVVDVGGGRIPTDLCGYTPTVGEGVWVLFIDGAQPLLLGPTTQRPGIGTVTGSPAGNLVPVTTTAGDFTLPYAAGLSLSAGQTVKLGAWNEGGFVFAVMSTSPPGATAPSGPGSGGADIIQVFTALDSGTYQNGRWWTSQVYASDSTTGAWFYGTKIADTIPDTASIVSIEIYISPVQLLYAGPNLGVHTAAYKPGGTVTVSSLVGVSVSAGWNALPNSFGDFLKANYGGIGTHQGGYNIFNSVSADAQSGALRIRYR